LYLINRSRLVDVVVTAELITEESLSKATRSKELNILARGFKLLNGHCLVHIKRTIG
jgi:hypothetical protein